jgi:hypothetical protein
MRACWFAGIVLLSLMPAPAFAACDAPVYRQFDFWVGNWQVTDAKGTVIGRDLVTKDLGGCVVREDYRDAGDPSVGKGTFAYDAGAKRWRHFFADDTGFVLVLEGSQEGGTMVLQGTDYPNGRLRLNRGVWRVRGDAVEELWTISTDGGKTWTKRFDGWFHRQQ